MELAACQSCLTDSLDTGSPTYDPEPPELSCHQYFDDTVIRAGVGVVWVDNKPCEPLSFNLGAQTSQYAEVAGILIVLQLAVENKIHALTICTDSSYAQLSFSCHLPLWKRNDKMFNDQADCLAKQGALTGSNWHFEPSVFPLPPVPLVCAVTRAQSQAPPRPAPSGPVSATVAPAFSDSDLLALQASDPAIAAMMPIPFRAS
ncbi:hypothetical protein LDENG_00238730%2C partial [Xyrichtys novacula]|uniref:RNase H type-1 domain-containing protein n=1 Tax=Xyrichtys novacula TaxID=13765 RepID=A0AAV1FEZ4_XYRNO|nr:hypothetical protein LDENG_00238730%2C partial [Xyrichtys novacula]